MFGFLHASACLEFIDNDNLQSMGQFFSVIACSLEDPLLSLEKIRNSI